MLSIHRKRLEDVRRQLAKLGADVLLVTHLPNLFYLCGFSGSAGALLVRRSSASLFTDGRYAIQARQEVIEARVRIARHGLLDLVGGDLRRMGKAHVGFESTSLSVAQKADLQKAAGKNIRWVPVMDCVEVLRSTKDTTELEAIREAARLGSRLFEEVLPMIRPGVREVELAAELEYRMRRAGASSPAFETIVAAGERSALPHARATDKALPKNGLVVLDWGAILRHYCCDLTRTVYLGRAPAKVRHWYRAVLEAQAAACDALEPGVAAGEVDVAARRVLDKAGLGRYFVHSTGHGLGLEVHEEPRLGKGQKRRVEVGNVVTVEPGVYVGGVGGIRIEDDVAVTSEGPEVLTTASRELLEL